MKKLICIISACFCIMIGAFMLVGCDKGKDPQIPLTVVKDGVTYTYSEQDDAYAVTDFDDSVADVIIQSAIKGKSIISIQDHAFASKDNFKTVTIPNTVKSIGEGAFAWCDKLTSVTLQAGSTLETIGSSSFARSTIKALQIPNTVKSIGEYAFGDCKQLSSITFQTGSNLEIIEKRAFSNSAIESITIPNTVTRIEHEAFDNCDRLVTVAFSNGTQNLKRIAARSFYGCEHLKSVSIPISIEYIGASAFEFSEFEENNLSKCVPCFNGGTSADEEYVFIKTDSSLTSLEDVTNFEKVRVIANNSFVAKGLTAADMSACTKLITIGDEAFSGAGNIESMIIPASVKYIGARAIPLSTPVSHIEYTLKNLVIEGTLGFTATKYVGAVGNDEYFDSGFSSQSTWVQFSIHPEDNIKYIERYIGYKFERQ